MLASPAVLMDRAVDLDIFFCHSEAPRPISGDRHFRNLVRYLLSRSKGHQATDLTRMNYLRVGIANVGRGQSGRIEITDDAALLTATEADRVTDLFMELSYPVYAVSFGSRIVTNLFARDASGDIVAHGHLLAAVVHYCGVAVAQTALRVLEMADRNGLLVPVLEANDAERAEIDSRIDLGLEELWPAVICVSHHDQPGDHHIHRILLKYGTGRSAPPMRRESVSLARHHVGQDSADRRPASGAACVGEATMAASATRPSGVRDAPDPERSRWQAAMRTYPRVPHPAAQTWLVDDLARIGDDRVARPLRELAKEAMPDRFPFAVWCDYRDDLPFVVTGFDAARGEVKGFPTIHFDPSGCLLGTQGWQLRRALPRGWRDHLPVNEDLRQWRTAPVAGGLLDWSIQVFDTEIRPVLANTRIGSAEIAARLKVPTNSLVQWMRRHGYLKQDDDGQWLPGPAVPQGMAEISWSSYISETAMPVASVRWHQDIVDILGAHRDAFSRRSAPAPGPSNRKRTSSRPVGVKALAAQLQVTVPRLVQWMRDNRWLAPGETGDWIVGPDAPEGMGVMVVDDHEALARTRVLWKEAVVAMLMPHRSVIAKWSPPPRRQ